MYQAVSYVSRRGEEFLKKEEARTFETLVGEGGFLLNLFPELKFQEILGFGSALNGAAAANFAQMDADTKKRFLEAVYGKDGLRYNMARSTVNSCDFAPDEYTYVTADDKELSTFSVEHDEKEILPLIRAAMESAGEHLYLFCSPWSPPAFMKDNGSRFQGGHLRKDCYEAWALYFVRFLEEYAKSGVSFDALTVQNESNASQTWESCLYTPEEQGIFVRDYLVPALKKAGLDTKILIWDHNKERVYNWVKELFDKAPGVREMVEGIAFHWYSGTHFASLSYAHEAFPEQKLLATEFCLEKTPGGGTSDFTGFERYAYDMIGNFNNYMCASVDWTLLSDENGGPFHNRVNGAGACATPVTLDTRTGEISLEPIYYAIKHFSRFVRRGAKRIGVTTHTEDLWVTAFENPDGEIVAVCLNRSENEYKPNLRIENEILPVSVPAHSLTTLCIRK